MCTLRVWGRSFDADRHLAESGLTAARVWRAGGEPRRRTKPDGERNDTSGFNVSVSAAEWDGLDQQTKDAIAFLTEREHALAELERAPGVEGMALDFPVELRIDDETVVVQGETFPVELVRRAGALGLALWFSIYPPPEVDAADADDR